MKRAKFLLSALVVTLLVTGATTSFAQKGEKTKKKSEKKELISEKMADKLDLNEQQREQMTQINEKYAEIHKDMKEQAAKGKELFKERMDEVEEVLSEEQFAQYKKMVKKRYEAMKSGGDGKNGARKGGERKQRPEPNAIDE